MAFSEGAQYDQSYRQYLAARGALHAQLGRTPPQSHSLPFCRTLVCNGHGEKKTVIGAIMHKLVHLIYGVIHSDRPFDAHYWAKGLVIQDGI